LPAGFGARCNVQEVPFHRSASVWLSPDLPTALPTAVHAAEEKQDTDSICPPGAVTFGECSSLHAGCATVAGAGAASAGPDDVATITAISANAASP